MRFTYRGQYSDAVLSELENQNEQHLEGISAKVRMLKDVRFFRPPFPLLLTSLSSFPNLPRPQSHQHNA